MLEVRLCNFSALDQRSRLRLFPHDDRARPALGAAHAGELIDVLDGVDRIRALSQPLRDGRERFVSLSRGESRAKRERAQIAKAYATFGVTECGVKGKQADARIFLIVREHVALPDNPEKLRFCGKHRCGPRLLRRQDEISLRGLTEKRVVKISAFRTRRECRRRPRTRQSSNARDEAAPG